VGEINALREFAGDEIADEPLEEELVPGRGGGSPARRAKDMR